MCREGEEAEEANSLHIFLWELYFVIKVGCLLFMISSRILVSCCRHFE